VNKKDLFYGVAKAFSEIGLSFKTVIPDVEMAVELYKDHTWYVMKKDDFTIIHAVPDSDKIDELFWEQWYGSSEIEPCHNVLFRRTPPVKHHSIYEAKLEDCDINPAEVCGAIWYVVEQVYPLGWALKIF